METVADSARRSGLIGVVSPPHMPPGFEGALSDSLRLSHELRVLTDQAAEPLEVLAEAFGIDIRSGRSLADDPRASGKAVLLSRLDNFGVKQWDATLRAFASGARCRSRYAPLIVTITTPAAAALLVQCGAVIHRWQGIVTRSDAMLAALSAIDHAGDSLMDRLAVETAVALHGWDIAGVMEETVRRGKSTTDLFTIPTGSGAADVARWEDGLSDRFEGSSFARFQVCSRQELRRRIWRAQVAVLFGWLEEVRLAFVERTAPLVGKTAQELSDWEWTELSLRLHGRRKLFAERCRRLRNCLAHREPVAWRDLNEVLQSVKELT